jgi:hypothetical protein
MVLCVDFTPASSSLKMPKRKAEIAAAAMGGDAAEEEEIEEKPKPKKPRAKKAKPADEDGDEEGDKPKKAPAVSTRTHLLGLSAPRLASYSQSHRPLVARCCRLKSPA